MTKVLEVNVDDLGFGGVFSLVRTVIENKPEDINIDIAAIEKFVNCNNIMALERIGTHVYYIGSCRNKFLKQIVVYKNLKELCKKKHYDYVHIHADVANKLLVSTAAVSSAGSGHIILHSHSSGVEGNYRGFKKVLHNISKKILKHFNYTTVACSKVAANWMFGNEETFIINNGVYLEQFHFDINVRNDVRKELNIANDVVLLGHVGRFSYPKNHHCLIEIFHKIIESGINAKLLLIGEGSLEKEVRQHVKNLELNNRVIFYGTTKEVSRFYQAMDIFLLPSHFEGLPVVSVEAQASGLPVLFSDKVTVDAKLIPESAFLSIDEDRLEEWVTTVKSLQGYKRVDKTEELKDIGYDISYTVRQFMYLYGQK